MANVFGGSLCLGHGGEKRWRCTCATMEEALRHVHGAMAGATGLLTEEVCSGCGKHGLLLDGPRPWVCSECEMRSEEFARQNGLATQIEGWKSKWAQAQQRVTELEQQVTSLIETNERLLDANAKHIEERQKSALTASFAALPICTCSGGSCRTHASPPTARQAESGPSAVASAKQAPVRRPLVVYSEED